MLILLIYKSLFSFPPPLPFPSRGNQESNDILLLDLSAEVDSNQNCIKGNPFVTSCAPNPWASLHTENPFSSSFGFFPAPDSDPFRDDPLSKSPTDPRNPHISLCSTNCNRECTVPMVGETISNCGLNGDSGHISRQMAGLSNDAVIQALNKGLWPLGGVMPLAESWEYDGGGDSGKKVSVQNPFLDVPHANGTKCELQPLATHCKDSVVLSPPPQNAKAGRGRRCVKVKLQSRMRYCCMSEG